MIVIKEKFVKVWTNFGNLIENFKDFKKNLEKFNKNLQFLDLKFIKSSKISNSALKNICVQGGTFPRVPPPLEPLLI